MSPAVPGQHLGVTGEGCKPLGLGGPCGLAVGVEGQEEA